MTRTILVSVIYVTTTIGFGSAFAAGTTGTAVNEGVGAAKPAAAPVVAPIPISTSINPNAGAGKKSQSGGSAANMAAAAMLMAACMATQPPNMALCMMGAMAGAQGGHDKDAAGQSMATQSASAVTGATNTNPDAVAVADPTYQGDAKSTASVKDQKAIAKGMAVLKEAGFTASASGIKSASGSIPAAAFSSSGAMAAAGIDPAQAKEAMKVAEKVSNDVSRYAKMGAVAEGTGGGSPGSDYGANAANAEDDAGHKPAAFGNPFAINDKARGEMMAGKTVNFDGEPIGVRGDNIFDMVHSAYQRKTAGKHFIETENDPDLNTRLPAGAAALRAMPKK